MSNQVDGLFNEFIEDIQRYGKYLLKDPNSDMKLEFSKMSPVMMSVCDARARYLTAKNVYSDCIHDFIENGNEIDAESVIETVRTNIGESFTNLELGEANKTYSEFRNALLKENNHLNDSDIATVAQAISTIDPITKLQLVNPMKNIKCGHVYEEGSILELIKRNRVVKCPIPGCTVNQVHKGDLVHDDELKRYLDSIKDS